MLHLYYYYYYYLSFLSKTNVLFVMLLYEQECTENLIKDILNRKPFNQTNKIRYIGTREFRTELWYPIVI